MLIHIYGNKHMCYQNGYNLYYQLLIYFIALKIIRIIEAGFYLFLNFSQKFIRILSILHDIWGARLEAKLTLHIGISSSNGLRLIN